jgi:hypothetical protein
MIIKLDDKFRSICQEIIGANKTEEEWAEIEASDMFQDEHYCGGFDASNNAFVFGYYADDGKQFSFLLNLNEISEVLSGRMTKVDAIEE